MNNNGMRFNTIDPNLSYDECIRTLRKQGHTVRELLVDGERLIQAEESAGVWRDIPYGKLRKPPRSNPAALRRSIDDAAIVAAADLLEAKYRTDRFVQTYITPDQTNRESNIAHDAIELAVRTWSESLAISLRAQRSMIGLVQEWLPANNPRPSRIHVERIRLSQQNRNSPYEGSFVIENRRGVHLTFDLNPTTPGVEVQPQSLSLAPSQRATVWIAITATEEETPPSEIHWPSSSALQPIPLDYV